MSHRWDSLICIKLCNDNCCCYIASAVVFESNARSHWLNQSRVDEFKSNVPQLVNISKIVDQPVNIAVAVLSMRT